MILFYFKHNKFVNMGRIPFQTINFCELTLVLSGNIEYVINGENVLLQDGDILCVPENSTRWRKPFENADYISFNFYTEENDPPFSLPVRIAGGVTNEIELLLSACDEIHAQMTDDSDRLCLILQCIIRQLSVNLSMVRFNPLTTQIKNYIASHLNEQISLEQIGKATFFSPAYCSMVFRRETGKSIIDYIIDEKVQEAKKLIIEGVPLKQVSEMLGFSDYNYFSRTFKKRVSYTPVQYKKRTFLQSGKVP